MTQNKSNKQILLVLKFLFSLVIGVSSAKADSSTEQIPGDYTANVTYKNADNPSKDSMVEGGVWEKAVKYTVAADGSADLTVKQDQMLNYMKYVKYIGASAQSQPTDMQKVDDGNGNIGSWKVHLSQTQTAELKKGKQITITMKYFVPGIFPDGHEVRVLIQIDSIVESDRAAYEQNKKLKQQNQQLQKQSNQFKQEIQQNKKLSQLEGKVDDLQTRVNGLKKSLNETKSQENKQPTGNQSKPGKSTPKPTTYTTYIATVDYTKPGSNESSVLNSFFGKELLMLKVTRVK